MTIMITTNKNSFQEDITMKKETSINELDKIAGGRLDDDQVHDAVLAMAQAHMKAKKCTMQASVRKAWNTSRNAKKSS